MVMIGLLAPLAGAQTLISSAVAWWSFEGDTAGTNSRNLTAVSGSTATMEPSVDADFVMVSGLSALNAGSQAVRFDGASVLKSNDPALRLGGGQTFWLRVNFAEIPTGTVALMNRSRAVNGQRGISLQMINGRLTAYVSSDGQTYEAQLSSAQSFLLGADTWYDIALRYDPSNSVRIDLIDPGTGTLLDTLETTSNVPASISTTNSIGNGYFQVGGLNNGSAGSSWLVPDGTLIEAAGIWNHVLTTQELQSLSSIPEPASMALLAGGAVLVGSLWRRQARDL